jgi:hypothetical protein
MLVIDNELKILGGKVVFWYVASVYRSDEYGF